MRAVGDRLQGVLESDVRHPRGRNPYAHVAGCVKERFGCSYGDLPDERVGGGSQVFDRVGSGRERS